MMRTGLAILLAGLFLYASVGKLLEPAKFAQVVRNYQLLPIAWVPPVAVSIPALELLCGVLLVVRQLRSAASLWLLLLSLVFLLGLGQAWWRGLDLNCGCFGSDEPAPVTLWKLGQNGCLTIGLGWLWSAEMRAKKGRA